MLSLGGRLILVRSVLFGLAVYWFALAHIPKSILRCLRCFIFTFLWGSIEGRQKMHLVDWHTISKPHEYGGWNIRNLEWFGMSLRFKSLWMVLNGRGTWSDIIGHIYLKILSVDDWLRNPHFPVQGTSFFLNGFIRTLSWITRQLG